MNVLTPFNVFLVFVGMLFIVLICVQVYAFRKLKARARRASEAAATDTASPAGDSKPRREAVWPFYALAAWLVFATASGYYHSKQPADPRVVAPVIAGLDASVKDFASIKGLHENLAVEDKLDGQIIVIDKGRSALHPLTRGLPRSRVARTPDEVGIVVWIEASRVHKFDLGWFTGEQANLGPAFRAMLGVKPSSTIPAYQAKWNVKVIDLKSKEVRYEKTFTGAMPPEERIEFRVENNQVVVYEDGHWIKGAEILTGDDGAAAGLVGPGPWEETLDWVKQAVGLR